MSSLDKPQKMRVPFAAFVEFVMKEGRAKETVVRNSQLTKYDPRTDFYKRFRTQFEQVHKAGLPITTIDVQAITEGLKEDSRVRKIKSFTALIDSYAAWTNGKNLVWFKPERRTVMIGELELVVSPNLGLHIDGIPYFIRLHLSKTKKMNAQQGGLMAYFMRLAYPELSNNHRMAVLDVRKGTLYEEVPLSQGVLDMLSREASNWVEIARKYSELEQLA
jgi:hypothetical protein